MRQIVIDTETTGLDPQQGHRIIEFAALELVDRRATGRAVHFRVDPERDIDSAATEVHGMTWEDLKTKPKFREVAAEFVDFARGAEWIIHNAPFDVGFLDAELKLAGITCCSDHYARLIDTLALARELYPGKRNGLDALCERFGIDNAHRSIHGALLDAQLLADVWIAMTRGQETLELGGASASWGSLTLGAGATAAVELGIGEPYPRPVRVVIRATDDELAEHAAMCERIQRESRGNCLWMQATAAAS